VCVCVCARVCVRARARVRACAVFIWYLSDARLSWKVYSCLASRGISSFLCSLFIIVPQVPCYFLIFLNSILVEVTTFKIFSYAEFQDSAFRTVMLLPLHRFSHPSRCCCWWQLPVKWQSFWWHLVHSLYHENECICVWKIDTRNEMKLCFVGSYKFDSEFKYFTSVFSTTWVSFHFMNVDFLPFNGFVCVFFKSNIIWRHQ